METLGTESRVLVLPATNRGALWVHVIWGKSGVHLLIFEGHDCLVGAQPFKAIFSAGPTHWVLPR